MHRVQQLPERSPSRASTPSPKTEIVPSSRGSYTHTVHHGGNQYFATQAMADIFSANAERIVARGETELVPLLHSRGVDLLLISPRSTVAIVLIEVGRLDAH